MVTCELHSGWRFSLFYFRKYVFAGIWSAQGSASVWSLHLNKVWFTVCSIPAWMCQSEIPIIPAASLFKLLRDIGGITRGTVSGNGVGGSQAEWALGTAGLISWNLSLSRQDRGVKTSHLCKTSKKTRKNSIFLNCVLICRESVCLGWG